LLKMLSNEPSNSLTSTNPAFVHRARRVGVVAVYIALALAFTVPLSWLANAPVLRTDLPSFTVAHAMGLAFSFLLYFATLQLYRERWMVLVKIACWIVLISASMVLIEFVFSTQLLFADFMHVLDPVENSDKISPNGAVCLFFSGFSALLLAGRGDRSIYMAQTLALLSASIALLALIGHAYSLEPLYGISNYSQMSLLGAIGNLLLACALLEVRPDRGLTRILVTDGPAGVMGRRLYSAALLVPPLLGFFVLTSSQVWKWYELPFAIVLLVTASITLFALVVAVTSRRLERADISRQQAEEDLLASRERLRELSAYTQVMQEEERVRIAREVHDELGQSLTALKMDVAMLRKQVPASEGMERRMNSMMELVNGTIQSVQRISSELRPSVLDDLGLAAAIEWQTREFEKRSGLDCHVQLPIGEIATSPSQATALFRIFQETLTNVARHANASEIDVQLSEEGSTNGNPSIVLRVRDNGVGFDDREVAINQSLGLMGMRERAALVGGTLELEGMPGEGMTVTVSMPTNA
jgi:signal transduction histidine kinase